MKLRYLGVLLTFILFVQHSAEQGFDPNLNRLTDGDTPPTNDHNEPLTATQNGGLTANVANVVFQVSSIARNTTSNLLHRLEAPRDRVLDYIRPAVRSQLSRNISNYLNAIWSRVQDSGIVLVQNPLVRTSIVQPINSTLERLKQITAPEDAELTDSNLEIVNLERPENEESAADYVASSASEEVTATPTLLIVGDELINNRDDVNNDELNQIQSVNEKAPLPTGEQQSDDAKPSEERAETSSSAPLSTADESLNPTKSRRAARFMDNYYVTPQRVRNLFDNVRQSGMQECLALAVCESNCRPHLYESYGRGGLFNRLVDRVEQVQDLNHPDWPYYLNAKNYGQQFYDSGSRGGCAMCHARYYCPHERDFMLARFSGMGMGMGFR